ncbi:GNAT family N-acetyltransferase [Actinoplanes awajinensis]|uniref:GCN5 family acetyltransferase n=1 Tax=Actinoplanes awajinensis subsp. mycoplanecinus TaxID=135947 RepID=A0A124G7A8_9ACTN|nr:GNAT family N-acetyltransferase [Actinoplanes awajinensis]KUL22255.1 GCN5 family acetyltransferase [Actinoplanes awajinensis subsp. mycoplanecinus]
MTTFIGFDDVLDNPAWHSLTGVHARFAQVHGRAGRYSSDVAPFHALGTPEDPRSWADLATLVEPETEVLLAGLGGQAGPGWEPTRSIPGVQLIDVALSSAPDPAAIVLGAADVPEILDLIGRTQPGPYLQRTVELGTYLGIRDEGRLVAMAGERLHPPGFTEISAVCTDPAYRGKGLATRLVRAVAAGILDRGETPFLHTGAANTTAIRLYEKLGFELRRHVDFTAYRSTARAGRPALQV